MWKKTSPRFLEATPSASSLRCVTSLNTGVLTLLLVEILFVELLLLFSHFLHVYFFTLMQCEEVAAGLQAGGAIASEKTLADVEPKYAAAKE